MRKAIPIIAVLVMAACSGPVQLDSGLLRVRPLSKKEAARLVSGAKHHLGEPYRYGGTTSSGWDCSGFTSVMYLTYLSYQLPRDTESLFARSVRVPPSQKRPGDLVFFNIESKSASHVGIYIGGWKFIHASTSSGIIISSLKEKYYSDSFIGFRRPLLGHSG